MRIDILNFRDVPSTQTWDASEFDLGVSPLYHAQFPGGEFLIGPKLSYFELPDDVQGFLRFPDRRARPGRLVDRLQHWILLRGRPLMSLGGFFSYTWRNPTSVCPNDSSNCQSGDYAAENVFSFTFGALF